jgi:inosine/xanthosine triphosphatase
VNETILNAREGTAVPSSLVTVRVIAVGSMNPVKIGATRAILAKVYPAARIDGVSVPSSVADQPFGDDETIRGAIARATAARIALAADLGVGIEGGVVEQPDGAMHTCAWAAIVNADGVTGVGGSLSMPLPNAVAAMVRNGTELGHAMDALIGATNTKHVQGAVGILTGGLVDRQRAYEIILSYAIAPFVTPEFYNR